MILLQEFDHWIKRYSLEGEPCNYLLIQEEDEELQINEGGQILIYYLFCKKKFENNLNYSDLKFILDISKWDLHYSEFIVQYKQTTFTNNEVIKFGNLVIKIERDVMTGESGMTFMNNKKKDYIVEMGDCYRP